MLESFVFGDERGRKYRINVREVDGVLARSEEGLNRGLGVGQPNLVLGCFKSIDYDLERCKRCGLYWKCGLTLESFVEEESLFKRWVISG